MGCKRERMKNRWKRFGRFGMDGEYEGVERSGGGRAEVENKRS